MLTSCLKGANDEVEVEIASLGRAKWKWQGWLIFGLSDGWVREGGAVWVFGFGRKRWCCFPFWELRIEDRACCDRACFVVVMWIGKERKKNGRRGEMWEQGSREKEEVYVRKEGEEHWEEGCVGKSPCISRI